jgi:hypothetical protein
MLRDADRHASLRPDQRRHPITAAKGWPRALLVGAAKEARSPRRGRTLGNGRIHTLAASGYSLRVIARELGVSHETVRRRLRGSIPYRSTDQVELWM